MPRTSQLLVGLLSVFASEVCSDSTFSAITAQTCKGTAKRIRGHTAAGSTKKPLAVYLHGSDMTYDNALSQKVTKEMAKRGFVAVNIEHANNIYQMTCDGWKQAGQVIGDCIKNFCVDNAATLNLDCSLGVAMIGYSYGGQYSLVMHHFNNQVTAAMSFSGTVKTSAKVCFNELLTLPKTKRRILIARKDSAFGGPVAEAGMANKAAPHWPLLATGDKAAVVEGARIVSGYEASVCSSGDKGDRNCIQADGSGYYVVNDGDLPASHIKPMGHLWLLTLSQDFDQTFKGAGQNKKWGLTANLDWVSTAAKQPNPGSSSASSGGNSGGTATTGGTGSGTGTSGGSATTGGTPAPGTTNRAPISQASLGSLVLVLFVTLALMK